jgi:DNA mismatch repair protein MLH1
MDNRDMLEDYFKIEIQSEGQKLIAIPQILPNHVPPMHRLPIFLFSLAKCLSRHERVPENEQDVLYEAAVEIALFYSLSYDWELDKKQSGDTTSSSKQRVTSMTQGYNEETVKWVTQHVVFPAAKLFFYPPKEFATDGTVREIVSISDLYKIFERC